MFFFANFLSGWLQSLWNDVPSTLADNQDMDPTLDHPNTVCLNVRYTIQQLNGHLLISLSNECRVGEAKQIILKEIIRKVQQQRHMTSLAVVNLLSILKSNQLVVIFAGRELSNDTLVGQSELENNSWVNVVNITGKFPAHSNEIIERPLSTTTAVLRTNDQNAHLDQISLLPADPKIDEAEQNPTGSSSDLKKSAKYFFVLCAANSCRRVRPGKLRVRCHKCHQETLILLTEPSCWDDVLTPERISGVCQREGCNGNRAEFYFKCCYSDFADHHFEPAAAVADDSDRVQPRPQSDALVIKEIRHNTLNILCLRCYEPTAQVFVFDCGHVLCLECLRDYFQTKLENRQFRLKEQIGYTLACPISCPNSEITNVHLFHVLGQEQYERYQRFAAEQYVVEQGGVYCPHCREAVLPERGACDRVICPTCHSLFCRACLGPVHGISGSVCPLNSGTSSSEHSTNSTHDLIDSFELVARNDLSSNASRWDPETIATIRQITKACPCCSTRVERNGGCAHMNCPLAQCGQEWCWVCEQPWTRDCQAYHWFD